MTFDHPQLLEALEHRTLILFLGADFLRTFTGLPSRADLARGMAERYGVTSASSLAQVAQRVSRAGNRFDFTDYLRRELDTAGQPVPAFYRGLATFAQTHQLPAIVTTVYDDFFDRALSDTDLLFDRIVHGSDVAFTRPDRLTLLKLYGDAQMPDTLVVTEDDHYGLWRDRDKKALLEEVKRTLQRNTVLFFGYNLSDPDFKLLWREVLDKLGRFARPAYAIWPGLPEEEQRVWRDRNIRVLESDPWGLAGSAGPTAPAPKPSQVLPTGVAATTTLMPVPVAPSPINLRPMLARLDDVELDTLCMDHFPAVHDKFARGLRWDEKVNLLLDHCRRNPEEAARLADLLVTRQVDAPITPQSLSAARTLTPTVHPSALPTGPIRNRWALLMGVDTYIDPAIPPLKYCAADVLALQAALEAAGYTVVALHDTAPGEHLRPTRDNVEAELARICQAAGPDDLIWVHFSCHGKLVEKRPVLITREVRLPTLAKKALPLDEVERELRASPARRRVITLDACHTGVELGRDLSDPEFIRNVHELAEGFVLLAASTSQQIAQEWDEKQHGVFTYFLLEGLSSVALRGRKGFVTVNDLTLHVLDNLRRWMVLHSGVIQEPTARFDGLGDMILVDFRSALDASPTNSNSSKQDVVADNPFIPLSGRITDPKQVFNRDRELRRVVEFLQAGSSVALIGPAAVGKSSLLTRLLAGLPEHLGASWETAYLDLQTIYNEEEFFAALCNALGVEVCRGYSLHCALQGRRIALAVDEVDKMAWEGFSRNLRTELRGLAGDSAAPLKLLLAARRPLDVLFPDSEGDTSPLANICLQLNVSPWDEATAHAFLKARLAPTGVAFTEGEITQIVADSGGHPQRLMQAAYSLFAHKTKRA